MTKYIWVIFGFLCLAVTIKLGLLAFGPYPRILSYKRWDDVCDLIINTSLALWAWAVLHP